MLCFGLALGESWLPPATAQTRSELPGCVMLAALPRRRLAGIEEVCPGTITPAGFTLIELSVVLVIIGLLVGGVLVGQDLIHAAEVRAQITQIEKYNSAVNTFRGKFNAVPGDMRPEIASQFGFSVGQYCDGIRNGSRDGNGLIDGWINGSATVLSQTVGETALFWQDLTTVNLIEGQFPNGNAPPFNCGVAYTLGQTVLGEYFPAAKIGHGNYVYVYDASGSNWFGVMAMTGINFYGGTPSVSPNISVLQAYNIDKKIDDGLPGSGNVLANYIAVSTPPTTVLLSAPNNATAGGDSTTCYDTTTGTYSVTVNNGSGANCALSFKMQGAGP